MRNLLFRTIILLFIVEVFIGNKTAIAQHTLEEVRVYDSTDTWVTGINNNGAICGYYFDPTVNTYRGFVVPPNGRFRFFFAATGYDHSQVMAIDNHDSFTVLIRMSNSIGLNEPSKVYKSRYYPEGDTFSTKVEVTGISPTNPVPSSINTKEYMAGWYAQGPGVNQPRFFWIYFNDANQMPSTHTNQYYATRHTISSVPQPTFGGGLNDSNLLCGYFYNLTSTQYTSYLFDIEAKSFTIFNNLSDIQLQDMNNNGFLVGKRRLSGQTRPFMGTYSGSTLYNIPIPIFQGSMTSEFTGVNDKEEIVGNYTHPATGRSVGFIYRRNREEFRLPGFDFSQHTWTMLNNSDHDSVPSTNSIWTNKFYDIWNYDGYDPISDQDISVTQNTKYEKYPLHYASSVSWPGFMVEIDSLRFGAKALDSQEDSIYYQEIIKPCYLNKYMCINDDGEPGFPILDSAFYFEFAGYCYGFTYTALQKLYDSTTYKDWFSLKNLNAAEYTNDSLREIIAIERFQLKQLDRDVYSRYGFQRYNEMIHMTTWKGMFRMKNYMMESIEKANPRGIVFAVTDEPIPTDKDFGLHSVLPYKLKTATTLPLDYPAIKYDTLFVYDSNFPLDSNAYILVNNTFGIHNKVDTAFSSSKYLHVRGLEFNEPGVKDLPEIFGHKINSRLKPTANIEDDSAFVFSLGKRLNYTVQDANFNTATLIDRSFENNIDDILPVIPVNSKPSPPVYYFADTSKTLSFTGSDYETSFMDLQVYNNAYTMSISRDNVLNAESDNATFANRAIGYGTHDNVSKPLQLHFVQHDNGDIGVNYLLSNFEAKQGDSILTSNPEGYQYKVVRIGGDSIEYNARVSIFNNGEFENINTPIMIPGNTTHIYDPFFNGPNGLQLVIFVDIGNTGTYNDTIFIDNTNIEKYINADYISVYPNPTEDILNIQIENNKSIPHFVVISDITGKTILNKEIKSLNNHTRLSLSNLSSGIYLIQIKAENQVIYRDKLFKK